MDKSENINMTQLSHYLNSKFLESGRSLSDEIENSEAVVDAMKDIYRREKGYEILKDNRRFLSYLSDLLPQNKSYILKFFGEPKVTSILMRFIDDSTWDNAEYERQIQLAIRDLDENVGKKPEDAKTLIMWTLRSFGKEMSVADSATLSEVAENFYQQALTHYNNKEYQEALDLFLKAGNLNHAASQNFIGVIYHDGLSGNENKELALEWYKKSAKNGNIYAATNAGWMLKGGDGVDHNYNESIKYYLFSYNHDYKTNDMLFSLGWLNAQQGNFETAKQFYEESITEFNEASSFLNLGVLYRDGKLGNIDNKKAKDLYEKSAELNSRVAYSNLGYFYENGIEVDKDLYKALELYEKAVELGYDEAKSKVERVKKLIEKQGDENDVFVLVLANEKTFVDYEEFLKKVILDRTHETSTIAFVYIDSNKCEIYNERMITSAPTTVEYLKKKEISLLVNDIKKIREKLGLTTETLSVLYDYMLSGGRISNTRKIMSITSWTSNYYSLIFLGRCYYEGELTLVNKHFVKGKIFYDNGDWYEGEGKGFGDRHGYGEYHYSSNQSVYKGMWKDGERI